MDEIKLSIIVPCYKVEKYLPRCLESLLNQTLDGIEIICINDGSPDQCLTIMKNYQTKYGEDRIVIIDKQNEGVWKGRKDGISIARGEFIGFVDSDDYVSANYAERLYTKAKQMKADIAVCGFDRVDMETGKLYSREMCKSEAKIIEIDKDPGALLEMNGAPWNKIYRAKLLKNMSDLKQPPMILDDMMFLLLVYMKANRIAFINESLVYYQVRIDSIINTINAEQIDSTYTAILEVKDIYLHNNVKSDLLMMLDAMVFLHFGVSLMFRLSYDKECDFKVVVRNNIKFMDENFPTWKKSPYITLKYVLKHNFINCKIWIVKLFYKMHMFSLFIKLYRFMIDRLKVDIKW